MSLAQLVAQNPVPIDVRPLVSAVENQRESRPTITLFTSQHTFLHPAMVEPFYEQIDSIGPHDGVDLFLSTGGGVTEVPWSIVAILKEFTDHLGILVPFRAMSGGTHIALAGEELVMGPLSALGSVDPKRNHHLLPNPKEPHSVQDLKHCVEFVNAQWEGADGFFQKTRFARARSESIGGVLRELFSHVHPLAVGALEQSFELARMVTRKVLSTRADFDADDGRIEEIVEQLAGRYFSHAFMIHRRDVISDLKLPVTEPSDDLWKEMRTLYKAYESIGGQQIQTPQGERIHYVAFIDTAQTRRVLTRLHDASGNVKEEAWVDA